MRISIVTGFFLPVPPLRGGSTEKIWHRLAPQFAAAGHEVTFVSRQWPGLPHRGTVDGVTHIRVPGAAHARSLAVNLWHDARWGMRVARALPPGDVVICNTVTLPAWLRRVKPASGRVVAVLARMPKGHGRAYGNVDLLLSLSETVSKRIRAENPNLASRLAPFPYPIDWGLHAAARTHRTGTGALTLGYVGRIHPDKGLTLLVQAAQHLAARAELPDWRLDLMGPTRVADGGGGEDFAAALLAQLSPALKNRVSFRGPEYDPATLARHYGRLDLFCYPSVDSGETFGVAVAEAMAARCTPVVSNLSCFRELVRDEETGLVFDHAAPDAAARLAAALTRVMRDAAFRRSLATAAQAHVRRFDFVESGRSVLEILTRLVASRRA